MKSLIAYKYLFFIVVLIFSYGCSKSNPQENPIDLCENVLCSNHGHCNIENEVAKCSCDTGYKEDNLNCVEDIIINVCDENSCTQENRTKCSDDDNIIICSCDDGYTEDDNGDCIKDINVCDENSCIQENRTKCSDDDNIIICSCDDGYTEDDNGDCIKDIVDLCENINCSNNGTCFVENGEAVCNCNYTHLSWKQDCIERIKFFDTAITEESNEKLSYFWDNYDGPFRNNEEILFVTRSQETEIIKIAGDFNSWNSTSDIMDEVSFNKTFRYKKVDVVNNNNNIYYKYIGNDWYADPNNIFFDFNVDKNSIVYSLDSSRLARMIVASPELGNNDRVIYIYLPKLYFTSNKKFPVMYMQDGDNIFANSPKATYGTWDVDINADEAISQNLAEPLIIVGVTTENRNSEYLHVYIDRLDNDILLYEYSNYLINTLKPTIDNTFRTLTDKENTAIAGSSLGGISSFFISWENSDVFSKAGVFSPSSWIGETEELDPMAVESMRDLIESTTQMPDIKIYMDSGDTNFDSSSNYLADSRVYTEYVRNLLVQKGWDLRNEWLEDGKTELINYPKTVDQTTVPTIYWSNTVPTGYNDYNDYLKPQNNLLHLVGAGHMHNESAWSQRFKVALIFLFPKKD